MARKAPLTARPEPAPAKPALMAGIDPAEFVTVTSRRMACEGSGGALGHPRVWLEMGEARFVQCPYCDRRFVLDLGSERTEDELLAPAVYEGPGGQ